MRSSSGFACSHGMPLNSRKGRDGGVNARTVARGIIVTFCNPCRNVINPVALCNYKTKKKAVAVWNQFVSPLHFVIK